MHQYDTVLKKLLRESENNLASRISGVQEWRWREVELPSVTQKRVDLLFETVEEPSRLIHWELQSDNHPDLPFRMAEYSLRVFEVCGRLPEQYVLYVGSKAMSMAREFAYSDEVDGAFRRQGDEDSGMMPIALGAKRR